MCSYMPVAKKDISVNETKKKKSKSINYAIIMRRRMKR